MTRTSRGTWVAGLAVLLLATVSSAGAPDRLDRFRTLAAAELAPTQVTDEPAGAYRELYALLDEEVVENLASGGVFASLGFLQDRLDAFTEAWGGTVVRLHRVGALVVGAFELSEQSLANTVRVYGELGPGTHAKHGEPAHEPALLATLTREGRPTIAPLPAAEGGRAQFLVLWEGSPASSDDTRRLRVDHVRQVGDDLRVVWSTADAFPGGLDAHGWSVRGRELRIRYAIHYPGWTPGCAGQTEQEDVYRLGASGTFIRVTRRDVNAWHRELRLAVARLLDALHGKDGGALAALVPDARVRAALPRALDTEPACDAREAAATERVSVAARAEHVPWQLVFQRAAGEWRLVRASPVLPMPVLE